MGLVDGYKLEQYSIWLVALRGAVDIKILRIFVRSKKTRRNYVPLMNKTTLMNLYDIIFENCLKCWVINYKTKLLRVLLSLISFSVWLSFFAADRLACCQTMLETSLLLTMPCSATKGYTSGVGSATPSCRMAHKLVAPGEILRRPPAKNKIQGITNLNLRSKRLYAGPHSIEIISIIFGSLLGVGHAERIKNGSGGCRSHGTRVVFFQEAMHVKYLL